MSQLLLEKPHVKGPAEGRALSKSLQGQGQGRRNMSQVIKSLPKVHDSGKHSAVVPTGHAGGPGSQPSHLPSEPPHDGPQTSVHNTFEYHDQRSQQVHVGVDPMVFSNMVFEGRRVIQESEEKARGVEQFAQEVYQQACNRIQELVDLPHLMMVAGPKMRGVMGRILLLRKGQKVIL